MKAMGATLQQIQNVTSIKRRALQYLFTKATNRGWNPVTNPLVLNGYIIDAPRPGRKRIVTREFEHRILKKVTYNRYGREKSCEYIAAEYGCSAKTVWRVLRRHGYRKTKPIKKPCLTKAMKEARLQFALRYKDWTIEDWKKVIFSDETSVQMGGVRSRRRVQRKKEETFYKHVVIRRWKGFSEFMQQSCFSYNEKGPYHIWRDETPTEKAACKKDLATRNAAKYEKDKEEWEISQLVHRLHATHAQSGKRAQFKHDEKTGAYVLNEGKGGVNWYRYQEKILKPLLLPFAKKCLEKELDMWVQEDKALANASQYQQEIFNLWEIQRLLWPGNSPNLYAIELT